MTREPGTYGLEELTSTVDGHIAYRVADPDISGSWSRSQIEPPDDIHWIVDDSPDDDDLEISITAEALGELVRRARDHCAGCPGSGCGR